MSSLPALNALSDTYQQAVHDFLQALAQSEVFELPEAQLALSTLDGLTEVLEWNNQGQAADEIACIWLSHLRWYTRTGNLLSSSHPYSLPRPFDTLMPEYVSTAADSATLSGLAQSDMQLIERNNQKEEKGAGVLLRVLPVALLPVEEDQTVAVIAAKVAALTHGSPQAISTAATLAVLARSILSYRSVSVAPLEDALSYTRRWVAELANNTAIPTDGVEFSEIFVPATSGVQEGNSALALLHRLVQELASPGDSQVSTKDTETLFFALKSALLALAGRTPEQEIRPVAQKVVDLLQEQWFKELGIV